LTFREERRRTKKAPKAKIGESGKKSKLIQKKCVGRGKRMEKVKYGSQATVSILEV